MVESEDCETQKAGNREGENTKGEGAKKSRFDTSEWIEYERTHTANTWGRSVKSPEERQVAYESFCAHIASGRFKESWYYVNEATGSHWTVKSLERWIRDTDEFPLEKLDTAQAQGFQYFEKILLDSASGKNTKANVATLQMLMRNKYGWDKQERREINTPEILASYERVMLLLSERQAPIIEAKPLEVTAENKA